MTQVDPNYSAPYASDFPRPTSAPYIPPTVGNPVETIPAWSWPQQPIIVRTLSEMCNHCWCETSENQFTSTIKPDHARCCKCGDTMHVQFIRRAVLVPSEPQEDQA